MEIPLAPAGDVSHQSVSPVGDTKKNRYGEQVSGNKRIAEDPEKCGWKS